jgi:hypothetical protein
VTQGFKGRCKDDQRPQRDSDREVVVPDPGRKRRPFHALQDQWLDPTMTERDQVQHFIDTILNPT